MVQVLIRIFFINLRNISFGLVWKRVYSEIIMYLSFCTHGFMETRRMFYGFRLFGKIFYIRILIIRFHEKLYFSSNKSIIDISILDVVLKHIAVFLLNFFFCHVCFTHCIRWLTAFPNSRELLTSVVNFAFSR